MEEEVCMYQKYGFYRFKEKHRKRHLNKNVKISPSTNPRKAATKETPNCVKEVEVLVKTVTTFTDKMKNCQKKSH